MYRSLLKIQLRSQWSSLLPGGKSGKKKATAILLGILLAYSFVVLIGMYTMFLFSMFGAVGNTSERWFYFGFTGLTVFTLSFITGIFSIPAHLFRARDNDLLLSMPVPPRMILGVRMTFPLASDFVFSILLYTIAAIVWLIHAPLSAAGILSLILTALTLPLLSFAIAALLGWLIHLLTLKAGRKNLISILLYFVFFGAYFSFIFSMQTAMTSLITNSTAIADSMRAIFPVYHMGRAISEGSLTSLLIWLAFSILPFLLVLWILVKNFRRIVTTKSGEKRRRYVAKKEAVRSPVMAIAAKEIRHLFGTPTYLLNAMSGLLILIIATVAAVVKAGAIRPILESDFAPYLPLAVCAGIAFITSMTIFSSVSVSLEGKNLWLIKTIPVSTDKVLFSKVLAHLLVTSPILLVCSVVLLAILHASPLSFILVILLTQLFNLLIAAMGVFINLLLPKTDFINEMQVVKQSASAAVSMFVGMGVALLLTIIGAILAFLLPSSVGVMGSILLLLLALCALVLFLIRKVGAELFEKLS